MDKRVALVTGSGRGIGKSIALELGRTGYMVLCLNRSAERGQKTVDEIIKGGGSASLIQADIGVPEQVQTGIAEALQQFKRIDVLVNNAGITRDQIFLRMTEDDWNSVLNTNVSGIFHTTKAVIRGMVKQRDGVIINISSIVGFTGNAGQVNYSSSKSAIVGFSKSLALELGSRNVRCNVVAPGFIETDMTDELTAEQKQSLTKEIPLARIGTPEDIAKTVAFLASPDANYITGAVLHVNGGLY